MKLEFAQIDARDFNNTYDPIAVIEPYCGIVRSKQNTKVMYEAIAEYLNRLKALQEEIVEKFEPLFEDDSHIEKDRAFCRTECVCDEHICKASKEHAELFYT